MEIYFDRKTLSLLKCIKRSGDRGVTWEMLRKKFGTDRACDEMLMHLSLAMYTASKTDKGEWADFLTYDCVPNDEFRSVVTPKGHELLERRSFDFWKWIIPTLISVIALAFSVLSLISRECPSSDPSSPVAWLADFRLSS